MVSFSEEWEGGGEVVGVSRGGKGRGSAGLGLQAKREIDTGVSVG